MKVVEQVICTISLIHFCIMSLFTAGVIVNCIAILMVIINFVYDTVTVSYADTSNAWANLIGFALAIVVIVAFIMKNSGKEAAANIILWLPGLPILLFLSFAILYILILYFAKGDWR